MIYISTADEDTFLDFLIRHYFCSKERLNCDIEVENEIYSATIRKGGEDNGQ